MRLRADQLAGALGKTLAPIYVLSGDEALLTEEAAAEIRQTARAAGHDERQTFQADSGFDWAAWLAGFDSLSLFASRRLVELRLPGGKPGVEGGKTLESWAAAPPPETVLIVSLPRADRAMQNSKWFTALERAGTAVLLYPPGPDQLPAWIGARLARHGLKAERDTLAFLAARVEGNLLAAHQEIEKLALLLPPGLISLDAARAAVTDVARYDAGDLPEALLKGDAERYCRIIDGLRAEGEAPPLALWLLAQELRALYRVALACAAGDSVATAMRTAQVWESRQALVGQALKRFAPSALRRALVGLSAADRAAKGLLREDAWQMLQQLGLTLIGRGGLPRYEECHGH